MIGINPATDSIASICAMLEMLDAIIQRYDIPTQACVLTHVTTSIEGDQPWRAAGSGVPVDCRHRGGQRQLRHQPEYLAGRL
jgi:ethanolamine ammonia-lyase large subunit